jgi:hypothetical protein
LDGGQGVQEPDLAGVPNEEKAKYRQGACDVGDDENVLAIVSVGHHPGDGADQERGQHPNHKETAHREAGLGQHGDQRGGSDQVEPISQQADDLAEPKIAKVPIATDQFAVSDWGRAAGRCCGQEASPITWA